MIFITRPWFCEIKKAGVAEAQLNGCSGPPITLSNWSRGAPTGLPASKYSIGAFADVLSFNTCY